MFFAFIPRLCPPPPLLPSLFVDDLATCPRQPALSYPSHDTGGLLHQCGVESIDIGMPHRGRLNVLANVMRKPMEEMLYEFMEGTITADEEGHLQVHA